MSEVEKVNVFYTVNRDAIIRRLDLETRFVTGDTLVPTILKIAVDSAIKCHLTDVVSDNLLTLKESSRLDFIKTIYNLYAMDELPADARESAIDGISALWNIAYFHGVEIYTLTYRDIRMLYPQLLDVTWDIKVEVTCEYDQYDLCIIFTPATSQE